MTHVTTWRSSERALWLGWTAVFGLVAGGREPVNPHAAPFSTGSAPSTTATTGWYKPVISAPDGAKE